MNLHLLQAGKENLHIVDVTKPNAPILIISLPMAGLGERRSEHFNNLPLSVLNQVQGFIV
ncbi:MAG: hypothetical protein IPK76_19560 [Lewinellaceae bacterium]|nr:hypothetical protein [Lewinellaceae bacterium]